MYTHCMGVHRRRDGSFYVRCDWDDCGYKVDLKSRDFWEAKDEAKRLGFRLAKDKDGRWVNFCHEFCKTCYFAPQVTIRIKRKTEE